MDPTQLRTVSFLRALSDEELATFDTLLATRHFAPRERIIEEGAFVTSLHFVMEGIVHVRRLAGKREMLLGRLGVGGFFGEVNLFDPGVSTASIDAMKPTVIASVNYESLREFMTANPVVGYKMVSGMMTEMARRLRQTSARLVNVSYWSGAEASLPPTERG